MTEHPSTGNTETLYMLTSPATDSIENMSLDAERRARERGCECIAPTFLHLIGRDQITCIVDHYAYCPLAGVSR